MAKWIWRAFALIIVIVYLVSPDPLPGPIDDTLLALIAFLVDRAMFPTSSPKVVPPVPVQPGASEEEVSRLRKQVKDLKAEQGPGCIWIAVFLFFVGLFFALYFPLGEIPVEATQVVLPSPLVPHEIESLAQAGRMVFDSKEEEWAKSEGLRLDYWQAIRLATSQPRGKSGLPDSNGNWVSPFPVYATFGAENHAGWETDIPDPRRPSTAGKSLAKKAIENTFCSLTGKLRFPGECDRQLNALKKLVEQPCIQTKYPGLTADNIYGSSAGAQGPGQGMPAQIVGLMSDWFEAGKCVDVWQDSNTFAEFMVRYLGRYANRSWYDMLRTYNPGESGSYTRSRRLAPAEQLQASWQRTFGSSKVEPLSATQVASVPAAPTPAPVQQQTQVVTVQTGTARDTLLLRLLRWARETDQGLQELRDNLAKAGELTQLLGGDRPAKALADLVGLLQRPVSWIHRGSNWLASLVYGQTQVLAAAGETPSVQVPWQQVGPNLATDIVVELDYGSRLSQAHVNNIVSLLARSAGQPAKVGLSGSFTIPANGRWSFVQHFQPYQQQLESWMTLLDPGASDLVTLVVSLALRTPGLSASAWRAPVQIPGFRAEESVDISQSRGTDLVLTNQTANPITINWLLQSDKVVMWVSRQVQPVVTAQGLWPLTPGYPWVDPVPDVNSYRKNGGDFGDWVSYMESNFHTGVDYYAKKGEPLKAARRGVVDYADWFPKSYQKSGTGRGWTVWLRLGQLADGRHVWLTYTHMQEIKVKLGQTVEPEEVIGVAGSSGYSSFVHSHTELRVGGGTCWKCTDEQGRKWGDGEWQDPKKWIAWLSGRSQEPPVTRELLEVSVTQVTPTPPLPSPQPTQVVTGQVTGFRMPLQGLNPEEFLRLPAGSIPGASRPYRCGVHLGWDFQVPQGTPVLAVTDGVVLRSDEQFVLSKAQREAVKKAACEIGQGLAISEEYAQAADSLWGQQIIILNKDGTTVSRFAHLNDVTIKVGDEVKQGQTIGHVGMTGMGEPGDVPELHLEIWLINGRFLGQDELEKGEVDGMRQVWFKAFGQ